MKPTPFAGRVLRWILPESARDVVFGDLEEEHRARSAAGDRRGADRWYRRQCIASMPGACRMAVRERQRVLQPGTPREGTVAQLWLDVRYTLRTWRRQPAFVLTAVTTQALGIAVTTAVAALASGVLLTPLPYRDPDALVRVAEGERSGLFSYADFLELRRSTRSLSHVAGYSGGSRTLRTGPADLDRVAVVEVTDGFFETLGVPMAQGRSIGGGDTAAQAPPVVILAHRAWVRRFGADPSVLGSTVTLNGQPHTVIGILPERFQFPMRGLAELWVPLRPSPAQEERGYWHWMDVIGRRQSGATDAQMTADLALVAQARASADPRWHAAARLRALSLPGEVVRSVRPALLILSGAVLLVLLVACANVAGLLVARAGARVAEMSVRAAVGAGTGRLVRQSLTEIVLLSSVAGAIGLAGGQVIVRAALGALPLRHAASLPNVGRIGLTPEVAAFSFGLSLAVAIAFAILPALRITRGDLMTALRGLRASSAGGARMRRVLVAAEIGLALVLATGTGLMAKSVMQLMAVSPGFDPRGVLTMRVAMPGDRYPDGASVLSMEARLREGIAEIPGVDGVAHINQLPLTGRGDNGLLQLEPARSDAPSVLVRTISPPYFDVMGIPLVEGRPLTDRDTADRPRVVVVNRALAEQVFAGVSPVGRRIWFEFFTGQPRWEIVGVVGDEQFESLDRVPAPVVYFPFAQAPGNGFSLVVRTASPLDMVPAVRRVAAGLDPEMPLFSIASMEQILDVSDAVFFRRTMLALLVVFAACALLLSAVAVYSTLAQAVTARTREIGIRVALGAARRDVFRLIVGQGMAPAAAGLGAGVIASLASMPVLRSLLFGVTPTDALTLVLATGVLLAVAFAGCIVPAWRALRIDAAVTLKQE